MKLLRVALLAFLLSLPGSVTSAQPREGVPALIEFDFHFSEQSQAAMVVSGEPRATKAGTEILRQGGNAVDAACTTALVLAVTLPRAGNIGGGGFALIRDPEDQYFALDFRETAPSALHPEFYLEADHSSVDGATSAGIPGTVAGLWEMHQRFGRLPWAEVVQPAEALAREGITVSAWMNDGLQRAQERLLPYPSTRKIFYPGGSAPKIGSVLVQADLAATLGRIKERGPQGFYKGETAELLVLGVNAAGGVWSEEDLASYRAIWREPLERSYRGYRVVSMPPPSSGGIHLLQMLAWLETRELNRDFHNGAQDIQFLVEGMRLASLDRAQHLGDPDFSDIPVQKLLSDSYLQTRVNLMPKGRAGDSKSLAPELFVTPPHESEDTTHFNVVDQDGMAVSLTYTLNFSYGSGLVAEGTGVLLNNEMDDFNVRPGQPNSFGLIGGEKNRVEAGKRPLSSMTPTLVSRDGEFFAAVGAPGGSRIINGVFLVLANILGYNFNAQTAVALPRFHHQWYPDTLYVEPGISVDTRRALTDMGYHLEDLGAVAHVLAIVRHPLGHLEGGLDPRRPASLDGY